MRWRNSLFLFIFICSAHGAYVVTNSGRQISGTKITASADGAVTLTTANGQQLTFRKEQYRQAVVDKPKELGRAEQLLKEGQGAQAVALLKKVQAEYRFLEWDQKAARLLADYYFEAGLFAEAVVVFQSLENQDDPDLQARHREALLKSGNLECILPMIGTDIAEGSREAAARAYLMRGDLKAANGDLAGARRDWLKVATFFKAQKDLAEQAEQKLGLQEELPQKNAK